MGIGTLRFLMIIEKLLNLVFRGLCFVSLGNPLYCVVAKHTVYLFRLKLTLKVANLFL